MLIFIAILALCLFAMLASIYFDKPAYLLAVSSVIAILIGLAIHFMYREI